MLPFIQTTVTLCLPAPTPAGEDDNMNDSDDGGGAGDNGKTLCSTSVYHFYTKSGLSITESVCGGYELKLWF